MIDILKYIKNYCDFHDIKKYALKDKVLTLNDLNNPLQSSGHINFIYKISAYGQIINFTDLTKKFLEVSSNTDFFDISQSVEIKDFTSFQSVECKNILTIENTANFKLYQGTPDAMFQSISNLVINYINVIPVADDNKNDNEKFLKLKLKL